MDQFNRRRFLEGTAGVAASTALGAGGEAGGYLQKITTIDVAHLNLLWLLLQSRPA